MENQLAGADFVDAVALSEALRNQLSKLKRRIREQSHWGDLTWPQVSVLSHLESGGPATVTTLARAEGIRPQSMGVHVAVLVEAGLISGVPDPHDGRQTIWSLTSECLKRVKAGRTAWEDWLVRAIENNLTAREKKDLANAVELMKRLADW